jgi:predicted acylesterase/phospholipase RssA
MITPTDAQATGRQPYWLAGISIGAVNAALIAGIPPDTSPLRETLRELTFR